jgi:hypothetical protein
MASILAQRNVYVSTLNAINITGSTISLNSTMVSLGQSTNRLYTTLAQGNYSTATNWVSTLNTASTIKFVTMSANAQMQLAVTSLSTVSSLYYTSSLQNWSTLSGATGLPTATQTVYSAGAVSGTGQYQILGTTSGVVSTVGAGGGMCGFISNNYGASFTNTLVNTPYIYLPFDNSTADVYGHTVTTTGTFTYGTGVIGSNSAFFNNPVGGTASYRVAVAWPGASAFTITGWFYPTGFGSGGLVPVIFHAYNGGAIIWINNNGTVYAGIPSGGGTNAIQLALSSAITTNTWYSFAYIFQSGGICSFYLNNVLIGSVTNTGGIGTNTISSIYIGAGSGGNVAFAGYMDDFRIYNNTFTYPMNYNNVTVSNTGQYMLATVTNGGLFTSSNFGSTWTQITSLALNAYWSSALVSASGQYMLTSGGTPTSPQQTGLTGNTSSATPVTTTWTVNGVTWTCNASSVNSSAYQPWIAFNNVSPASATGNYSYASAATYNTSTGVYNGSISTAILGSFTPTPYTGEWLQIQSSVPVVMYNYSFSSGGAGNMPKTYLIVGSNDGTNWYPIHLCSMGSNAVGAFVAFSTYITVNYTGTQTVVGTSTVTATTTSYATSTTSYTYFRLIANTTFGQYGNLELCEWYINFLGGQSYSTNYGQSFTNALSMPSQVLAMSENGQYTIGSTANTYYIQPIAGFTSVGYTSGTVTGTIVAAAASTTGQQMVLVTNNISGNNVYYSTNYGATFTGITITTLLAMTSCSMSYDGSYITVTNGTTIYQLNNNSNGFSLALGNNAGVQNQGQNAIALGNQAGYQNQSSNSIILNASGSALNSYYPGLYAAPIALYSALTSQSTTLLGYGTDNQIVQSGITLGTGTQMIYGEWIQLQLMTPSSITSYVLQPRSTFPGRYPAAWTIVGSIDGVNWVVIDTQSGRSAASWGTMFTLKTPSAIYSYFRIIITQVNSTIVNSSYIFNISGFILYNGLSIFSTYGNYTVTGTQYNILNYNSVPVCIVTYSWNPSTTNSLGIVGDATANFSAYQIAYIATTNAYTNANYFLGFTMLSSLLGLGEYNSSYIAFQGTATPVTQPLLQVNDMYGNTKFQSTVQYPLDVNGVMRTQQLQFQDGTIQSTASNMQYNWALMGVNWTRTSCPAGNWYYCALNYSGQYQMAVANTGQLYVSANYGSTWTSITTTYGLSSNTIGWQWCAMSSSGQYMAAGYQATGTIGGIYLSYNYGQTWNYVQVSNYYVGLCAMSASGQYILAAPGYTGSTTSGYIFVSSNYGQTWTQTTQYFSGNGAGGIAVSGNGQYMAYQYPNTVYLSSTYGQTWTALSLTSPGSIAMSYTGQYIAIQYSNTGIYISSNYGVTFSTNTTPTSIYNSVSMSSSGQYIFLNSYSNGTIYTSTNYGSTFSIATTTNYGNMYGSGISGSGQYQLAVCAASGYVYISATPVYLPSFTPFTINGNVGIGTTTLTYPLNVVGNINLTGSILYNGTAITTGTGSIWTAGSGGVAYYNGGNVGIGTATPLSNAYIASSAYQGVDIQGSTVFDGETILRLLNPASQYGRCQLHIIGRNENGNDGWSLSGGRNNLVFGYQTSFNSAITYSNAIQSLFGALGFFSSGYSTGTPALSIAATGLVSINGTSNMLALVNTNTGATTYMSFTANGTNYGFIGLDNSAGIGLFGSNVAYGFDIGTPSATPLSFFTSNVERMRITPAGNVGIGISGPSTALHVIGSITTTTGVNVPGSDTYQTVGLNLSNSTGTATTWQFSIAGSSGPQTQGALYIYGSRAPGGFAFVMQPTTGNLSITGALSKGSGTFDIEHPLYPNTKRRLVHSFIEGPRCDLIYRGTVVLINGSATVYIDKQCTYAPENAMDDGTFEALCANPQYFLQNMSGFNRVIGSIYKSILTITCESNTATDMISWMVVAERKDPFVKNWDRTDSNGYLNTQYIK